MRRFLPVEPSVADAAPAEARDLRVTASGTYLAATLAQIERDSAQSDETQIFIETPYRNDAMLADILQACRDDTRLAIAASITGTDEKIRMDAIEAWRARPVSVGKRPAVFLLLAASRGRA